MSHKKDCGGHEKTDDTEKTRFAIVKKQKTLSLDKKLQKMEDLNRKELEADTDTFHSDQIFFFFGGLVGLPKFGKTKAE